MNNVLSGSCWRQALPRIAADIAMVHLSALAALAAVVLWQAAGAQAAGAGEMIEHLRRFYLTSFLPLSVIFPAVFLLSGFYTRSRNYAARHKLIVLARGATAATLIYLFANFLFTRADMLPRSATILFLILVNGLTAGSRILKRWMSSAPADSTNRPPAVVTSGSGEERPVLIVGGAGYIGSILCRKLLAEGRRVRLLDSFVYGDFAVRDLFGHPRFELHIGDCRNIQSVVSAVNGTSSIIHLAAIVGDPACEQDKSAALEINYSATRMMIEIAKGYGVERFLFASSCSVYGETEQLVDERSALRPISLYAQTKVDSEQALLRSRTGRFHPTILRLATVFGNSYRPRFDLVVNLLTAKALRERVITIYNGEQWRPFIHVSDVAEGFQLVHSADLKLVSGETYNLGDSRLNFTLRQVAEIIAELAPGTRVEHVENPDRRNYRVSFDKIYRELGFQSKVHLRDGVLDLKDALVSGKITDYAEAVYHNQRYLKAAGRLASAQEMDTQVMAAFALTLANHQLGLPSLERTTSEA
jgi:nucleoside-diphosphate-sugar epimerase